MKVAEGDVMMGMSKLLAKNRPTVFIECSEIGRGTTWQAMKDLDYRCLRARDCLKVNEFNEYAHDDFLWLPD